MNDVPDAEVIAKGGSLLPETTAAITRVHTQSLLEPRGGEARRSCPALLFPRAQGGREGGGGDAAATTQEEHNK